MKKENIVTERQWGRGESSLKRPKLPLYDGKPRYRLFNGTIDCFGTFGLLKKLLPP